MRIIIALILLSSCTGCRKHLETVADMGVNETALTSQETPPIPEVSTLNLELVGVMDSELIDPMVLQINLLHPKVVNVHINSGGGSVLSGLDLIQALEQSGAKTICTVDYEAASMAFIFFQTCNERIMTKRSFMMMHEIAVGGRMGGQPNFFKNMADALVTMNRAMVEVAAKKLKISADELEKRISGGRELWMGWRLAKELGAVDTVLD